MACESFVLVVDRKSADLELLKIAQQRFKQVKESLVMRFSGDGKSDITLVVWDFGGQKVRRTQRRWRRDIHTPGMGLWACNV